MPTRDSGLEPYSTDAEFLKKSHGMSITSGLRTRDTPDLVHPVGLILKALFSLFLCFGFWGFVCFLETGSRVAQGGHKFTL